MYRHLRADEIIKTVDRLRARIAERFPEAGLTRVAEDLLRVAQDHARRSREIRKPRMLLRLLSVLLVLVAVGVIVLGAMTVHPEIGDEWQITEVVQTLEAGLGALFFLGAGIVFLLTIEGRIKRRRCMDAIHEMRAMAHIVDMHQLTKDPERVLHDGPDTAHSPTRALTVFELGRYLDYCSEMLSLMGKIAAHYVQGFPDPQAVAAVDEVEGLTTNLGNKIWQKIMVLDRHFRAQEETGGAAPPPAAAPRHVSAPADRVP